MKHLIKGPSANILITDLLGFLVTQCYTRHEMESMATDRLF